MKRVLEIFSAAAVALSPVAAMAAPALADDIILLPEPASALAFGTGLGVIYLAKQLRNRRR